MQGRGAIESWVAAPVAAQLTSTQNAAAFPAWLQPRRATSATILTKRLGETSGNSENAAMSNLLLCRLLEGDKGGAEVIRPAAEIDRDQPRSRIQPSRQIEGQERQPATIGLDFTVRPVAER